MLKQMDREDLNQLWALVKETLSIRQASRDKEKELWVDLKRLFEPDFEDQLWTYTKALMHDPVEWKLYDICGVHHVFTRDQEIFMLVERDYPLRRGLAISEAELTIREKIDLINELVKYQDHHAKIIKYQAQQSKPLSKKEQMKFYMSVLRGHSGWKTKHFRGMTLEKIKEKFIPIWKQVEDFVPMASKEEGERIKRKGLKLEQGSAKRIKASEDVSKEDIKEMMQLVPVEEVYVEALQVKHPIIDWEIHSEGQRDY
nr:hypothetical protein [Tanacetum cinerariifolium]